MSVTPLPICGLGAVAAAGIGPGAVFARVSSGEDTLRALDRFDSGLREPPLCAQVHDDLDALNRTQTPNRTLSLALPAVRQAMAPLPVELRQNLGVVLATTVAGIARSELFYRSVLQDPLSVTHAAAELSHHEPTAIAAAIARDCNARGMHSVSTACSTGLHALWLAAALVNSETYSACLAVGTDALSLLTIRGFSALTLLDPHGCRPFDARRAGISLGEGAGAVLIANPALCRDAAMPPVAWIQGWGASADAYHMSAPHPEGEGAARSMRGALAMSGIPAERIDLIVTHGTATPDNDLAEARAIRTVFSTPPPLCSMKRTLGHTLAASGTLETVCAIMAMQEGTIPATGGFALPDNAIGLSPSPRTAAPLRYVLKNAFGFGGNNASVVMSATRDAL